MGALIAQALVAASRRDPPEGFPASPKNIKISQPTPGAELQADYEMEAGAMAPWMAKVIGDGVAAGVISHLRADLDITSSVAVDGVSMAYGSEASTGANLDVDLEFQPRLVVIYSNLNTTMAVTIKGMITAMKIKGGVVPVVAANTVLLGAKKFTFGTDADINPPAGAATMYWVALGDRGVLNARGASTTVQ